MAAREELKEQAAACSTAVEFAALALQALEEPADREYAEELAEQIDGLCVEVEDAVALAGVLRALGRDEAEVRAKLDEAEVDCQFTKQFVSLARGYRDCCGDDTKMRELMEQAEEFCMTDEERIDLGDGLLELLGEPERAAECYRQGLAAVQDKNQLLELAERFAAADPELAGEVYARAEEKMSSGAELSRLAASVRERLGDAERAAAIYARAVEQVSAAHELLALAGDCRAAGLDELAGQCYDRAIDGAADARKLIELLAPLRELPDGGARVARALERARELARETAELLELARQAAAAGAAAELVRAVLEAAEEQVASLGEMKAVVAAAAELAGDDDAWRARLDEKLAKREANQERYAEFQQREQRAAAPLQLLQLADAVVAEIEDVFYARKLLGQAQALLAEAAPDCNLTCALAGAVARLLDDGEWAARLLGEAADAAGDFATVRRLARAACAELSDRAAGRALARDWYGRWERGHADDGWSRLRLGRAVLEDLADADWALQLAEAAAGARDAGTLLRTQAGLLARDCGAADRAGALFRAAFDGAGPDAAVAAAKLLRQAQVDAGEVRALYRDAMPAAAAARLPWAEGILEVFGDPDWGAEAYAALAAEADAALAARIRASRESRLGRFLVR